MIQNGDVIWNKILRGTGSDQFNALGTLNDGNYMVVGQSSSTDEGWNHNLEKSYGGSSNETIKASVVSPDQIVIVANLSVSIDKIINTSIKSSSEYASASAIYQKSDGDYLMRNIRWQNLGVKTRR